MLGSAAGLEPGGYLRGGLPSPPFAHVEMGQSGDMTIQGHMDRTDPRPVL